MPDAMLAYLIRPTGAECRSDKALTPHPTLMTHHPCASYLALTLPFSPPEYTASPAPASPQPER
ncbi:mannitol-1-phosphate 5-dehydrogenase [Escherichia coli]|nr:mannitol-1-phosphate 5-dehydrogenase [Escherichia coli]